MAFSSKICWMLQHNGRSQIAPTTESIHTVGANCVRPQMKGEIIMDFYKVPIGFGMALAQNEAAMLRYAQLEEAEKQNILNKAHNVRSEKEMYTLVASLAGGTME